MNTTYADEFAQGLKEERVRALLVELILKLDECDSDDELGTEGWRHRFSMSHKIPTDS